jgi:hypothetical protein
MKTYGAVKVKPGIKYGSAEAASEEDQGMYKAVESVMMKSIL